MNATATKSRPARTVVTYQKHSEFFIDLKGRVDGYFERSGKASSGGPRMWLKTATIAAWLVTSYVLLLLHADIWWAHLLLSVSVGLAGAGVGFNIQHDGGHKAYAQTRWGNRISAFALDLIGGSSYVWNHKHNILHHQFTNVEGVDDDVDSAPFLRMAPTQQRRWYHRFQHWYAFVLFGFLPPKWAFIDDPMSVVRGRVGPQPIPRPKPLDLTLFVLGKVLFVGWIAVIPLLMGYSLLGVIGTYALVAMVVGVTISVVFQLAHVVEEAEFIHAAPGERKRVDRPWAEHQLATTVDFAPRNPFLTWYLGGLNFQVEHHLFPTISHMHYPALSKIVSQCCSEYGVAHHVHKRFMAALRSHVRHMRSLGRSD